MKDYYKTLGVDKSASKEEIKKAFRKMAHQYHPDKGGGEDSSKKFKEASEAYAVLSDDDKRKKYDMFGSSGMGAGGSGGFNPNDFGGFDFSGFQNGAGGVEFDLGDIFGDIFGGSRRNKQNRGHDISIDIEISFEDSVFGIERDIFVTKTSKCQSCHGSGSNSGSGFETCTHCNGKGRINEVRRSFLGAFTTTKVCEHCHGQGQIPKSKCQTCKGSGVTERQQEISVKIPAGIENGEMIRLGGMGEAIPFGVSGDLYVKVFVKPHPIFRKDGNNLVTTLGIKLTQALIGAEVNLKTLDGDLVLNIPEGTNTGDILRVKGKGVPNDRGKRGDLLVHVHIDIPKKLSKEAKKLIENLKNEGI